MSSETIRTKDRWNSHLTVAKSLYMEYIHILLRCGNMSLFGKDPTFPKYAGGPSEQVFIPADRLEELHPMGPLAGWIDQYLTSPILKAYKTFKTGSGIDKPAKREKGVPDITPPTEGGPRYAIGAETYPLSQNDVGYLTELLKTTVPYETFQKLYRTRMDQAHRKGYKVELTDMDPYFLGFEAGPTAIYLNRNKELPDRYVGLVHENVAKETVAETGLTHDKAHPLIYMRELFSIFDDLRTEGIDAKEQLARVMQSQRN